MALVSSLASLLAVAAILAVAAAFGFRILRALGVEGAGVS